MANSKYDFHKEEERITEPRFNRGTYIIVRVDGHKFHAFTEVHRFDKPNDKRALDLMVESAKQVIKTFKGHIPLAYGHSDEFSFLIRSSSSLLSRRVFKITSMIPVVFATYYNSNWDRFFQDSLSGAVTEKKYDAWFDARPKEYPNFKAVIDYFRWRQVDCHINNLYNTTLHAMSGRYVRYELLSQPDASMSGVESLKTVKRTPITDWIKDQSKFSSAKEATEQLSKTVSSDKHDIMFLRYGINYNNELEQFKKGSILVDIDADYGNKRPKDESIRHLSVDLIGSQKFWDEYRHIFDDFIKLN